MRLLPPTRSGYEQHNATDIDNTGIGMIAGLGAVTTCLALTSDRAGRFRALRSSSRRVALLTRCIAYGTAVAVPFVLHNRYVEQQINARSLRTESTVVPKTIFLDRLSHFDSDNAILLGGLTGIYIASRFKKTGLITGWRRYAAAMAIGAAPPTIAFWMCRTFGHKDDGPAWSLSSSGLVLRPVLSNLELGLPSDFVRSALDYAWSGDAELLVQGPPNRPRNDGSSVAMLGLGGGMGDDGSSSGGGWLSSSATTRASMKLETIIDRPHIAVKQDDKEPEFQPQTNYGWYSDNKIAELEEHIAATRVKRQQLAQEAEVVWAWLAEKEVEHLEKYP